MVPIKDEGSNRLLHQFFLWNRKVYIKRSFDWQ
jgi:hypothetical protein